MNDKTNHILKLVIKQQLVLILDLIDVLNVDIDQQLIQMLLY
jgi:hypothetical protein